MKSTTVGADQPVSRLVPPDSWPLMRLYVLTLAAGGVWTVLYAMGVSVPRILMCLVMPAASLIAGLMAWHAAKQNGLHPAARRFWRHLATAEASATVGCLIMSVATFGQWTSRPTVWIAVSFPFLAGSVGIAVWALLRLPVGTRTSGEWLRLALDGATVTVGAAVFLWHFVLRPLTVTHGDVRHFVALLMLVVCFLVALVAVVKVVLVGSGPVPGVCLRLLAMTLLAGGLSSALSPLSSQPRWIGIQPLSTILPSLFICLAAQRQVRELRLTGQSRSEQVGGGPRTYSLLPYLAVGATTALLGSVILDGAGRGYPDLTAVAGGSILVTGIVVFRQLLALRDNDRLLAAVRQKEQRLLYQATHDALTGLVNRSWFGEHVSTALGEPGNADAVAICFIDLDDFKGINDTLGHAAGDAVLIDVARRLRTAVPDDDVVARLGGDEFAVLLRGVPDRNPARIVDRMLEVLAPPIVAGGHEMVVHASIGVASARPGDNLDAVLRNADLAMYAAKDRGKNGYVEYTSELAEPATWCATAEPSSTDESSVIPGTCAAANPR